MNPSSINLPATDLSEARLTELRAWLHIALSQGVGPRTARALLEHFGPPEAILEHSLASLAKVVGSTVASALKGHSDTREAEIEASIHWLQSSPRAYILTLSDPSYPKGLLELADPPPVLFAQGLLQALDRPMLAIVGARHPTRTGEGHALAFAKSLAEQGFSIVSGMARGIDAAAHRGAMSQPAATVAVVGHGPDICYPRAASLLHKQLGEGGLILSEYSPGTPPIPAFFPRRNRLIAALGQGTLVVEAAAQSGSLITARHALDLGREVFAIPGSIDSPVKKGCHELIRQGAKLVESAQDVLQELRLDPGLARMRGSPEAPVQAELHAETLAAEQLLGPLGWDPLTPEQAASILQMSVLAFAETLTEWELSGFVERLADGRIQRVH